MVSGLVLAERYELIEKLGAGGMGSVWRARDKTLSADIALKLLAPQFIDSDLALSRFRREAQAAAAIRSTHVVQILDHGVDKGIPFIAMELLKGESLSQRLQRERLLSPELTSRILGQVARALSLAHAAGIVHRDMKPDNVFLVREDEDLVSKVLDFGIARQHDDLGETGGLRTRTGAILGTPHYMSPEQATGQAVDHLTDIWSYGVIACECLTGRRVFSGGSIGILFHAICIAEMPTPSQLGPVPSGFDEWFARAVARDKSVRFQSVKEASDELKTVCGAISIHPVLLAASADTAAVPPESVDVSVAISSELPGQTHTGAPSAVSVASLTLATKKAPVALFVVAATLVAVLLLAGWRWLAKSSVNSSVASAGSIPSVASSLLPSSTPVAPEPPITPIAANSHEPVGEPALDHKRVETPRARAKAPSSARPAPAASTKAQPRLRGPNDNAAGI